MREFCDAAEGGEGRDAAAPGGGPKQANGR
jgi:hypothetical protein